MFRNKKLAIFDLDGVLLDSKSNMERAWAEVQTQLNVTIPFHRYFALIGRPFQDIMTLLGLQAQAQEAERVFRMASMAGINLATFYADVPETLSRLAETGHLMAVVTSKDTMRTNAILAMLPVEFISIQTPHEDYRGKPAPDHLLLALAQARTDPADAFYIGDMDADREAAKRAGIDYVHAAWGYGEPPDGCPRLERFFDILKVTGAS